MEIIKTNLYEIKKSGSLKTLGGLLALFHLLQWYLWWDEGNLPLKLVQQGLPMCRSLFESCEWMQFLPLSVLGFLYYAYAVLMALAVVTLLLTELTGSAFICS
ncbi:MAG: hypothetical protein HC902_09075 [Calothrix sp. SM1_5_4]|nr:hypothetical protein [Calothrix sp. SM1_5_4]